MEISAVNPNGSNSSLVSQLGGTAVDQQAFLNLLVTQLRNQDPLEPTDNEQFLAQLATFTQLEESQAQGRTLNSLLELQAAQLTLGGLSQGASLVGKNVSYIDPSNGREGSGLVESVTFDQGGIMVEVGGRSIPAGNIVSISSSPLTPAASGSGTSDPTTDPNAQGGNGSVGGSGNGSSAQTAPGFTNQFGGNLGLNGAAPTSGPGVNFTRQASELGFFRQSDA